MNRVLVDLLFMTGKKGGMETYVRELYRKLPKYLPNTTLIGLVTENYLANNDFSWFPGQIIQSRVDGNNRVKLAIAESFLVGNIAKKNQVDLIHSPANLGPWISAVPVVLTIHDTLSFSKPEYIPGRYAGILRVLLKLSAKAAAQIITVSQSSAREIEFHLGIPKNLVHPIPLALPLVNKSEPKLVSAQPMMLAVGNNLPHKNFELILKALEIIPPVNRPNVRLVGGNSAEFQRVISKYDLGQWVEHLGWVDEETLVELYSQAQVFVLPSEYEGYGLPVLEAMSRGCPVICSDLGVLREVAGDAAEFFRSNDAASFAASILKVVSSKEHQLILRQRGYKRVKRRTWGEVGSQTSRVFLTALGESDTKR